MQNVHGDAGVFRVGIEAVDAGEIDEDEVAASDAAEFAEVLLDGDAGVVGDLLAQTGEAVEERGFAGVGRADESDGADFARDAWGWWSRDGLKNRNAGSGGAAVVHSGPFCCLRT